MLLWGLLRVPPTAAPPAAGWEAPAPVLAVQAAMLVVLVVLQWRIKDIIWQGCSGVFHLRCPVGRGASMGRPTIGRLHGLVLVQVLVLQVVLLVLVLLRLVLRLVLVLVRQLHVPILQGGSRVGAKHSCGR